jgi:uncharacterized protein YdeI (YjbR/CyaY-like superfamily)
MEAKREIDSYIKKRAPFAQEICQKLRDIIHHASPEVQEAVKWGSPAFIYKGKLLCIVWAFKQHASIVFNQGSLINDKYKLFNAGEDNLKGRTIKFTDKSQIDGDKIIDYIRQGLKNIDEGKSVKVPVSKDKTVVLPDYIKSILKKEGLLGKYEEQIYTYRKGYRQWIEEAKQEATKQKRIEQMVREVKEGKKYMNMPR